jgi:hypothetical protein
MSDRGSEGDRVRAILVGAIAGLATCVAYPLVQVPLPRLATVILACNIGPLLGVASWGLREFLDLHRRSFVNALAASSNGLAGALLSAMLLVQLAVGIRSADRPTADAVSIWLGLDVAWDVYIGLGTLLFSIGAFSHPRLGRVVGVAGVLIALGLLALNLYTFPTPPAAAGLVDLGPAVGLWYLVVTILVLRSLGWARGKLHAPIRVDHLRGGKEER